MRLYFHTGKDILKSSNNSDFITRYLGITINTITTTCSSISDCSTCSSSEGSLICDSCKSSKCVYILILVQNVESEYFKLTIQYLCSTCIENWEACAYIISCITFKADIVFNLSTNAFDSSNAGTYYSL